MNMELDNYTQQAESFLRDAGVVLVIEKAVPQVAPNWAQDGKHGTCWAVTMVKLKHPLREYFATVPTTRITRDHLRGNIEKERTFLFWSSIQSKEDARYSLHGEKKPTAYDILAGVSIQAGGQGSFEDFCANFGFYTDSRKAESTYKECLELHEKLRAIFTPSELEKLAEIQ